MKYYWCLLFSLSALVLFSCYGNREENTESIRTSVRSEKNFQGIWIEDETGSVLFRVVGDTIYYPNSTHPPVHYQIVKDSLYIYGNEASRYFIKRQTEYEFWLHSFTDNIIKLYKSENESDSIFFINNRVSVFTPVTEVIQRDSIVVYGGKRYRAYVFINPSKRKVYNTSYSENGLSVDNIYYDNIMHICVYEGKDKLYASDVTKDLFINVVPADFLRKAVLSDMNFIKIDHKGYHYISTLCIPENSVCYEVKTIISFKGEIELELIQ